MSKKLSWDLIKVDPNQKKRKQNKSLFLPSVNFWEHCISSQSVRRILLKRGIKSYTARQKPLLTRRMIKARLDFCKNYGDENEKFWQNVVFSVETYTAGQKYVDTWKFTYRSIYFTLFGAILLSFQIKFLLRLCRIRICTILYAKRL